MGQATNHLPNLRASKRSADRQADLEDSVDVLRSLDLEALLAETSPSRSFVRFGDSHPLVQALAILTAIDQGQLLGAAPAGAGDRQRHEAAVALLGVQRELLFSCLEQIGL